MRTLDDKGLFSIRTPRHHLIWDRDREVYYFFDLEADPLERRNLSSSGDPEESRLRARLEAWIEAQAAASRQDSGETAVEIDDELREQLEALGYVH